jgi:exodeoxyribonuclease VII large subunit
MEVEQLRLDKLAERIPTLFSLVKTRQEAHLDRLCQRLSYTTKAFLSEQTYRLERINHNLTPLKDRLLTIQKHRLDMLAQRMEALDPALLLKRGYSITLFQGKALRDAIQLSAGDEIVTRLEKGVVKSIVESL